MNASARPAVAGSAPVSEPPAATVKAVAGWVAQFARTLKTCRLYDATNPTVVRFRDELAQATTRLLDEHGAVRLQFSAHDVTWEGISLHPARSRDDNLAYPFHRDGVRAITLQPGLDAREVAVLLDAVLAVTGQNLDADDLVTLLWEANLKRIDVDYVPAEGDAGSGGGGGDDPQGALMPWPVAEAGGPATPDAAAPDAATPGPPAGSAAAPAAPPGAPSRSEDWLLSDLTVEAEAGFAELDALAPSEIERFHREFVAEHAVSPVAAAFEIAVACLHANANDADRAEMGRFLPRVVRGGIATGCWAIATDALRILRELTPPEWSEERFAQELLQPVSVARAVEKLDAQDERGIADFLALESEIGDTGIDWVVAVLSESQQKPVRQRLAESLAARCATQPERLAAWLSDTRWYVVRNIVHILGWIGTPAIVGPLQVALRHDDARVREQVIEALANLDVKLVRPLLIRALDGADSRQFCQILRMLSLGRDPATARFVFAFLQQERFPQRPPEERRAIYAALASIGGDEIVHDLEAELLRVNWFDRSQEVHRLNVARCLARIATPLAREALDRAAQSKRAPVRQAAVAALTSMGTP